MPWNLFKSKSQNETATEPTTMEIEPEPSLQEEGNPDRVDHAANSPLQKVKTEESAGYVVPLENEKNGLEESYSTSTLAEPDSNRQTPPFQPVPSHAPTNNDSFNSTLELRRLFRVSNTNGPYRLVVAPEALKSKSRSMQGRDDCSHGCAANSVPGTHARRGSPNIHAALSQYLMLNDETEMRASLIDSFPNILRDVKSYYDFVQKLCQEQTLPLTTGIHFNVLVEFSIPLIYHPDTMAYAVLIYEKINNVMFLKTGIYLNVSMYNIGCAYSVFGAHFISKTTGLGLGQYMREAHEWRGSNHALGSSARVPAWEKLYCKERVISEYPILEFLKSNPETTPNEGQISHYDIVVEVLARAMFFIEAGVMLGIPRDFVNLDKDVEFIRFFVLAFSKK